MSSIRINSCKSGKLKKFKYVYEDDKDSDETIQVIIPPQNEKFTKSAVILLM